MYLFLLTIHNIARWFIVFFGILAVVRAYRGFSLKNTWTNNDRLSGIVYTSVMDLQLLIGIVLYFFFSPFSKTLFTDFGGAMSDAGTRYFAFEHVFVMIIAVVFAHMGTFLTKKAKSDNIRHRIATFSYGVSLFLVMSMIPWPFMTYGRPLLRFFGFEI